MERRPIIAGNWKMFKTGKEAKAYLEAFKPLVASAKAEVYLGVPYTALSIAADVVKGSNVEVGAQNMHDALDGAFTGEISAPMLKDAGATFVILGHSERRHVFGESDAFINKKVKRALSEGLSVVICIGELEQEREDEKTEAVLKQQLDESLADITSQELANVVIAYEPVWAIGTGKTATAEIAEEAHLFCRDYLANRWGKKAAAAMRILYGGSVKPENIAGLMAKPNIDGALVGGASLKPDVFSNIVNY